MAPSPKADVLASAAAAPNTPHSLRILGCVRPVHLSKPLLLAYNPGMSWENQYMQMVKTKPGFILAEEDRSVSADCRAELRSRLSMHAKCFVELGSGSGLHLLRLAEQHPATLCVGLEIRFKRAFKTGEKAERDGLENLLVLRTDARQIPDLFSRGEVAGFFVNYPDPWDKRRWRKNRLMSPELLSHMRELLAPGGFLRFKTDHQEYFASTEQLLVAGGWRVCKRTTDLLSSEFVESNIPTEFEGLFRSQGKPLCMLEAHSATA